MTTTRLGLIGPLASDAPTGPAVVAPGADVTIQVRPDVGTIHIRPEEGL